jgi:hypothetical protein
VIGRTFKAPGQSLGDSSSARLAGCDESLSTIAADVAGLLDELEQLRDLAGRLADRHAEQEAVVERQRSELADLEVERLLARRRAEELQAAETRLAETDGRAASLELELGTLRQAATVRERQVAEIEAELTRTRQALRDRDAAVQRASERLAELERNCTSPAPKQVGVRIRDTPPERTQRGHVRFISFPDGYRLDTSDERCARPGDVIEVHGRSFVVTRVGRSPLPDDRRPCAFLMPGTPAT